MEHEDGYWRHLAQNQDRYLNEERHGGVHGTQERVQWRTYFKTVMNLDAENFIDLRRLGTLTLGMFVCLFVWNVQEERTSKTRLRLVPWFSYSACRVLQITAAYSGHSLKWIIFWKLPTLQILPNHNGQQLLN